MWRITKILFAILISAVGLWLLYEYIVFPDVSKLQFEDPVSTSLIEQRKADAEEEGRRLEVKMNFQPLAQISPNLQKAVIASEDQRFFEHNGFDWEAIQKAWDEAVEEGKKQAKESGEYDPDSWIPPTPSFKRGASTISQQLVKNLYLSEDRNFLRKGREALITFTMERELSKHRILEIYLNVIEWGDGIYGAEAASRHYFRKSASNLSVSEAAYLAAMVPSPLNVFNPKKNPKRVRVRQRILTKQMKWIKIPSESESSSESK